MGKSGLADLTEGYEERIKALGRVRIRKMVECESATTWSEGESRRD